MKSQTYIDAEFVVKPLGFSDIRKAVDLLRVNNNKMPIPLEIQHNDCKEFFDSLVKNSISEAAERGSLAEIYGMRVIERSDIPKGQIRMVDKDGNLIQVFNFKN